MENSGEYLAAKWESLFSNGDIMTVDRFRALQNHSKTTRRHH